MRLRVIINPSSGRQALQKTAYKILDNLLAARVISQADVFRTEKAGDAYDLACHFKPWEADLILAVGGDGTMNEVINGLIDGQHKTPLAVLPAGTVNDFAYAMNIPRDVNGFCAMIRQMKILDVDAGRVGDRCFLNVAAAGMLTDVAYKVPSESKTVLGKLAYVLSGAMDLPNQFLKPVSVTIESDNIQIEEDILLFLIANTKSVAGFRLLAPQAEVDDGLLDVVVIHRQSFMELLPLLIQMVNGEHLDNPKVTCFQTKRLTIQYHGKEPVQLDMDGEPGPKLPVSVECVPSAIRMLIP